mgnify:CR=1 FL=1
MTITVSTDGSALGNPNGPMGWAWADHEPAAGGKPGHEHAGDCDAGGATNGTNQIGELCAVLEALRAHPGSEDLVIETDSQYAINCSTKWVQGWKRNGWKNSQKKPVKNADLIRATDYALPAIEVVDSRIANWNIRFVDTVADNASSGLFVLGSQPRRLGELDLTACAMEMKRGETVVSTGNGRACLGSPLNAAVWLADMMVRCGRPLQAGDIVLTGALGPMVAVQSGDRFDVRIDGLGTVSALFA